MMKDYLVYTMMNEFGVNSSCAATFISRSTARTGDCTWPWKAWKKHFWSATTARTMAELYKPDSMSFGAGRGNGGDFDINDLGFDFGEIRRTARIGRCRRWMGSIRDFRRRPATQYAFGYAFF